MDTPAAIFVDAFTLNALPTLACPLKLKEEPKETKSNTEIALPILAYDLIDMQEPRWT
jgi:hypothetical protein